MKTSSLLGLALALALGGSIYLIAQNTPSPMGDSASPSPFVPQEITLKKAVKVPLILDGKVTGNTLLPAGKKLRVVKIENDKILIDFAGSQVSVSSDETDLQEQMAASQKAASPAPDPSSNPSLSKDAATPNPKAVSTSPPPTAPAAPKATAQSLQPEFMQVMKARCVGCHKVCGSVSQMENKKWILPGNPKFSPIYTTIGVYKRQPKPGQPPLTYHNLSNQDKQTLYDYIEALGAQTSP